MGVILDYTRELKAKKNVGGKVFFSETGVLDVLNVRSRAEPHEFKRKESLGKWW